MYSLAKLASVMAFALGVAGCFGTSGGDGDGDGAGDGGEGGNDGAAATGGTGIGPGGVGGAGSDELTVIPLHRSVLERVDLLLMIDNSIGMAEKQALLAETVMVLVDRFIRPLCVAQDGELHSPVGDECPDGTFSEIRPIEDMHIGVLSSSLGSHGGTQCTTPEKNDYGALLASRRDGLSSWDNSGFLAWDPSATHSPPGESNAALLADDAANHVLRANQSGCGYEAPLEAWYRFLVDPEPVGDMTNDGIFSVRGPINLEVLQQRERFLRSDSTVVIVMLSDENDCSIIDEDGSQGWLVGHTGTSQSPFRMPRASSACAADPNDACCRPCAASPAAGCADNETDTECSKGVTLDSTIEDHPNLRCFKQRQRFGVDLLYPTSRYVEALTEPILRDRQGVEVPNPLFMARGGRPARDPAAVMLVGVVGVPWQDVADEASQQGRSLRLLNSEELIALGRWDVILGPPGGLPLDPHMHEQIDPRPAGAPHPFLVGAEHAIAAADSTGRPNVINGHEQNVSGGDDLQYACIFPLSTPVACDPPEAEGNDIGCDCNAGVEYEYNRPTCSYPGGPETEGVQEYGKAYPSIRQLEVLRDLGSKAVVGSICPKNTAASGSPAEDLDYGYNPIVSPILASLARVEDPGCLPRAIHVEDGRIPCHLVSVAADAECACAAEGESVLDDDSVADAVRANLSATGRCGGATGLDCDALCLCDLAQLDGAQGQTCREGAEFDGGFCYVDEGPLLEQCPNGERWLIRWPSGDADEGASPILVCSE